MNGWVGEVRERGEGGEWVSSGAVCGRGGDGVQCSRGERSGLMGGVEPGRMVRQRSE